MYGIKSLHPTPALEKLEQIKTDSRKFDNALNKFAQLEDRVNELETKLLSQLIQYEEKLANLKPTDPEFEKRVENIEHILVGHEDETALYDENNSVVDQVKALTEKVDEMRSEYVDLIGSYIENGTPRLDKGKLDDHDKRLQKLDEIERRVQKLEERPKFQVSSAPLTKDNLSKLQLEKVKK